MKKFAVIVAGGSGSRMGAELPKQFLNILDKPILFYTLQAFLDSFPGLEIILVLQEAYFDTGHKIVASTSDPARTIITAGGETRFHSVKNGLEHIRQHSIVFVHDGVRCLVTPSLIRKCYETALESGNAIPAINAVDSIRIENINGNMPVDRNNIRIIQTPQTFSSEIIKTAFEQEFSETFTDEASVVEKLGIKIHLVDGEDTNIKITRPIDLLLAEKILEERSI